MCMCTRSQGQNEDCPNCHPLRCYEQGKCWQYITGFALDDYITQEGLRRVHMLQVDTEGHDAFVLEGLRGSLARGVVDVLEFEFNSKLGAWNSRSTQHRTLNGVLQTLDSHGYGCFWQTADGCLSPASGQCYRPNFERVGWSNLVCARGQPASSALKPRRAARAEGDGAGVADYSPLADLWEIADECAQQFS